MRTCVVLVLGLCLALAGCNCVLNQRPARFGDSPDQQRLKAALEKLGASARLNDDVDTPVLSVKFLRGGPTDADLAELRPLFEESSVPIDLNLNQTHTFTEAGLAHLADLPTLWGLGLSGTKVTDAWLVHLAGLTNLEELSVSGDKRAITDAGLANLKALTKLRKLSVYSDAITAAGYVHLEGLTELEELHVGNVLEKDAETALPHMKGMTNLRELSIGGDRLTDAGLAHLQGMTELRKLTISGNDKLTRRGLRPLSALRALEELTVYHCRGLGGDGMAALEGLINLRDLDIQYCGPIGPAATSHLSGLTGLKKLHFFHYLEPGALAGIAGLTGLEELDLSNTGVGDEGVSHLGGLTGLKTLDLRGAGVTDAGLKHLAGMTALRKLNLMRNPIQGPGLHHLGGLSDLRRLHLDYCKITGPGLDRLEQLSLDELSLDNNPLTDAAIAHLKPLTGVKSLTLSGTKVTDAGCLDLKRALSETTIYDYAGTEVTLENRAPAGPTEPVPNLSNTRPAFSLTAQQYWTEFRDNRDAADDKYRGRVVELAGVVSNVGRDGGAQPYIWLKTPEPLDWVMCGPADPEPWASITPGQNVKVKGQQPDRRARSPALMYTVVVEKGPDPAVAITPAQLAKEFAADAQAAREKYRDKWVRTSGVVADRTFEGGDATVHLKGDGDIRVTCLFAVTEHAAVKAMKPGQTVKFLGEYAIFEANEVRLTTCLPITKR